MEFLRMLEGIRTPFLDGFFQLITYLGQEIPILLMICVIYWCLDKALAYRIGISFFSSGLILQNLKITFRVDRPWILDSNFHPVKSAVSGATGYSFPSGHSQSAASFWGTLAVEVKNRGFTVLLSVVFLLVGFSRMYLGCHTPQDVLVAFLLGLISVWFAGWLMKRLKDTKRENLIVSMVLAAASFFTALYSLVLLSKGTISPENAMDCIKASGAGLGFALGWYVERTYIRFSTAVSPSRKVKRFGVGVILLFLLKILLGLLLGDALPMEMLQNFFLVLFIIALYPFLFRFERDGKLE